MQINEFEQSLKDSNPPAFLSQELKSLWYAKKGDWEKSHSIAQDIDNANGAWIHAYLHRFEGDVSNARYWYRLAGKEMPSSTFPQELEHLIQFFLVNEQ